MQPTQKVAGYLFYNMLKSSDGYHVYGWMRNELHLEGGDLTAFAIVYCFVKGYAGTYTGNTSYLSSWTGWSENTSRKHLVNLVALGLLKELRGRNNNSPFCHYVLAPDFYQDHPSISAVSPLKNYAVKSEVSTPQKLRHKENSNKENIEKENIPPTPQDVVAYCKEQGFADPEGFADYYLRCQKEMQWRTKSGKQITNWKLNIQQWRKYHQNDRFPRKGPASLHQTTKHSFQDFIER